RRRRVVWNDPEPARRPARCWGEDDGWQAPTWSVFAGRIAAARSTIGEYYEGAKDIARKKSVKSKSFPDASGRRTLSSRRKTFKQCEIPIEHRAIIPAGRGLPRPFALGGFPCRI